MMAAAHDRAGAADGWRGARTAPTMVTGMTLVSA